MILDPRFSSEVGDLVSQKGFRPDYRILAARRPNSSPAAIAVNNAKPPIYAIIANIYLSPQYFTISIESFIFGHWSIVNSQWSMLVPN